MATSSNKETDNECCIQSCESGCEMLIHSLDIYDQHSVLCNGVTPEEAIGCNICHRFIFPDELKIHDIMVHQKYDNLPIGYKRAQQQVIKSMNPNRNSGIHNIFRGAKDDNKLLPIHSNFQVPNRNTQYNFKSTSGMIHSVDKPSSSIYSCKYRNFYKHQVQNENKSQFQPNNLHFESPFHNFETSGLYNSERKRRLMRSNGIQNIVKSEQQNTINQMHNKKEKIGSINSVRNYMKFNKLNTRHSVGASSNSIYSRVNCSPHSSPRLASLSEQRNSGDRSRYHSLNESFPNNLISNNSSMEYEVEDISMKFKKESIAMQRRMLELQERELCLDERECKLNERENKLNKRESNIMEAESLNKESLNEYQLDYTHPVTHLEPTHSSKYFNDMDNASRTSNKFNMYFNNERENNINLGANSYKSFTGGNKANYLNESEPFNINYGKIKRTYSRSKSVSSEEPENLRQSQINTGLSEDIDYRFNGDTNFINTSTSNSFVEIKEPMSAPIQIDSNIQPSFISQIDYEHFNTEQCQQTQFYEVLPKRQLEGNLAKISPSYQTSSPINSIPNFNCQSSNSSSFTPIFMDESAVKFDEAGNNEQDFANNNEHPVEIYNITTEREKNVHLISQKESSHSPYNAHNEISDSDSCNNIPYSVENYFGKIRGCSLAEPVFSNIDVPTFEKNSKEDIENNSESHKTSNLQYMHNINSCNGGNEVISETFKNGHEFKENSSNLILLRDNSSVEKINGNIESIYCNRNRTIPESENYSSYENKSYNIVSKDTNNDSKLIPINSDEHTIVSNVETDSYVVPNNTEENNEINLRGYRKYQTRNNKNTMEISLLDSPNQASSEILNCNKIENDDPNTGEVTSSQPVPPTLKKRGRPKKIISFKKDQQKKGKVGRPKKIFSSDQNQCKKGKVGRPIKTDCKKKSKNESNPKKASGIHFQPNIELMNSIGPTPCGQCDEQFNSYKDFYNHALKSHCGLARPKGENQIFDKAERLYLFKICLKRNKKLTCYNCWKKFRSGLGYDIHIKMCGTNESDKYTACLYCNEPVRITNLPKHLSDHRRPPDRNITPESIADNEEALERPKRKCLFLSFEDMDIFNDPDNLDVDKTFTVDRAAPAISHVNKRISSEESNINPLVAKYLSLSTPLVNQLLVKLTLENEVTCPNIECFKCFTSVVDFKKHLKVCDFSIFSFYCKVCKFSSENYEEVNWHSDRHWKHDESLNVFDAFPLAMEKYCIQSINFCREFREENFSQYIFPEMICKLSDWRIISERRNDMLTDKSVSFKLFSRETDVDWVKLESLSCYVSKNDCIIYSGGDIIASAWCPLPDSADHNTQYLALVCSSQSLLQNNVDNDNFCYVQIWALHITDPFVDAEIVFAFERKPGRFNSLHWCPSGAYQKSDEKPERLGILSAACSDGSVCLYVIPHPHQLSGAKTFYEKKPDLMLTPFDFVPFEYSCTQIDWFIGKGHEYIAGCYSSGFVSIWDLTTQSEPWRITDSEGNDVLRSSIWFRPHLFPCTSICFCPNTNGKHILTTGLDRLTRVWDLDYLQHPLTDIRKGVVTDSLWLPYWTGIVLSFDESIGIHTMGTIFKENEVLGGHTVPVLPSKSSVWCLTGSYWYNGISQGNESGVSLIINHNATLCSDTSKSFHKSTYSVYETRTEKLSNPSGDESFRFGICFYDGVRKPPKEDLKSTNADETLVNLLRICTSQSWNNNYSAQNWIFTGNKAGLGRFINISSLKKKKV